MPLPHFSQKFLDNLTSAVGRAATEDWIARLPRLLDEATSRWDLELGPAVDGLSYNYVCFATLLPSPRMGRRAGEDCILKIGIPSRELTSEIECLRLLNNLPNCLSARLLASDPENGLLLLERLRPGKDLTSLADDDREVEIAADLMARLWIPAERLESPRHLQSRPPPANAHESTEVDFPDIEAISIAKFIRLKNWFDELKKLRPRFNGGTGPFPARLVETAEGLLRELFTEDDNWLIHGDCHHYNILSHGDEWRVIDPKGVIGAREYEVAPFMLNPVYSPRPNIKRETQRRLDIFSERLGLDRQRLWAWTVAHSVLSAWWDLQEDGTGGEFAIACGEAFLELG